MNITALLELKQNLKVLYIRFEIYVKYALRFLLAILCVGMINVRMGYRSSLSGFIVTLSLALICAVLPTGFTAAICAALILAHLYALSLESCVLALVLFLCVYLLYYRFSPHDAVVILLTPLLFAFHVPHIMPFVLGLLFTPVSVISMSFGVVIWFYLHNIALNVNSYTNAEGGAEETLSRVQDIVGMLADDKTMFIYIAAFALTALLVYILRRQSFDRAWFVAIGAGAFVNLIVLLVGDLALDASVGIAGAFIGTLLGAVLSVVILFFSFNVDYSRVERVQFEDEEYYYYVKAVPKIALPERQVRTKSINRAIDTGEDAGTPEEISLEPSGGRTQQRSRNAAKSASHGNGTHRAKSARASHDSGRMTKERQRATRSGGAASK